MRTDMMPWNPDISEKIEIFKKAKNLIEKHGIDDYVLENRQMTCMGGIRYVVTSKAELDKKYVGYKGFYTYEQLCERIEQYKYDQKHPEEAERRRKELLDSIKKKSSKK
jgi:hypothetical protein